MRKEILVEWEERKEGEVMEGEVFEGEVMERKVRCVGEEDLSSLFLSPHPPIL